MYTAYCDPTPNSCSAEAVPNGQAIERSPSSKLFVNCACAQKLSLEFSRARDLCCAVPHNEGGQCILSQLTVSCGALYMRRASFMQYIEQGLCCAGGPGCRSSTGNGRGRCADPAMPGESLLASCCWMRRLRRRWTLKRWRPGSRAAQGEQQLKCCEYNSYAAF